jgi:hypothetical protein
MNKETARWIPVEHSRSDQRNHDHDGGFVEYLIRTEFLPIAVRSYTEESPGVSSFVIEFLYVDVDEGIERLSLDENNVTVEVGRKSGRLMRLLVPIRLLRELARAAQQQESTSASHEAQLQMQQVVQQALNTAGTRVELRMHRARPDYRSIFTNVVAKEADTLFARVS